MPFAMPKSRAAYAVWELTLKCNLACVTCGSRAGPARPDELSTAEALDLVRQLKACGIGEVSIIGGEAFLRPDYLEIARAIRDAGMVCSMTTGGYGISRDTAQRMRDAGIAYASISLDGLEESHDRQRGVRGSYRACFKTMEHFRAVGLRFGANTQLNRLSAPEVPTLYERVRDGGAESWQCQMTVPMGNAADNAELLLQPVELLDLYPMLARVANRANREGVEFIPGSSIGYFGPYERVIRAHGYRRGQIWMGCQAGLSTIGIEADGKVKADPSLPTETYTGGNIRLRPLREILMTPELTFNLGAGTPEGTKHLWGFCGTCEHAELCRAGCSWSTHVFFGRRGNNVYCHHRAVTLAARGRRERVVRRLLAIGKPFDHGVFDIIEEPLDAPWPEPDPLRFTAAKVAWGPGWEAWPAV
jgi:radical SAM protein with 4Fe4S-binding SPASM domain